MNKEINYEEIRKEINDFPTKSEYGFTKAEITTLLNKFKGVNLKKFQEAMYGNTCMMENNELINYHHDVEMALICGLQNRSLKVGEWD
jgi:Ca2+-binding EF-hand superfamily protein